MKKYVYTLLSVILLFILSSCGGSNINQKETYLKIQSLVSNYTVDDVKFTSVLTSEEKNITLTNTGTLQKQEEEYTYSYSYQYLNKIGSGETGLVSTVTGTLHGTRDEVFDAGFEASSDYKVVALNLKDSFKTYNITEVDDTYSMKGFIARNTIIKNTANLDDDIRFNYELIVDKEITKVMKLIVTYGTVCFDTVVITITF